MKIYKCLTGLLFTAFLFSNLSYAKFIFDVDYCAFRSDNTKSTIEIYLAFYNKSLLYTFKDNNYSATANIEVFIVDKRTSKEIFDNSYGLQSVLPDTSKDNLAKKLIGQLNYNLAAGEYEIKLIGRDLNVPLNADTIVLNMALPAFDLTKTQLSDIQIASVMDKSADTKSIFYKNGLEITPNPNSLFGKGLNVIHYYYEVYALRKDFNSENVIVKSAITDLSGTAVFEKEKIINSDKDAIAQIGQFALDTLQSGSYYLKIKLTDPKSKKEISAEKKFFVFNSSGITYQTNIPNEQEFLISEFAVMKEDRLDEDFAKTIYLRNQKETDEYKSLKTLAEKRKYMYNFWKKRDETPFTPQNENMINYFKRINEANNQFRELYGKDGWQSDRGRIYVTYGKPDDIEKHLFESDVRSYEIWSYNSIQGGSICVFIERESETGIYTLEHSTIRGELQNDNWQTYVKRIKQQ